MFTSYRVANVGAAHIPISPVSRSTAPHHQPDSLAPLLLSFSPPLM